MLRFLAPVLLLLAAGIPCAAQEHNAAPPVHPIDSMFAECLDVRENQTTYGMILCAAQAREAWDAELNRYYKLMMDVLEPPEKEKLRAAQRAWLVWRDAEYEFSGLMHDNLGGSMWKVLSAERATAIVRQRAEELRAYYETIVDSR